MDEGTGEGKGASVKEDGPFSLEQRYLRSNLDVERVKPKLVPTVFIKIGYVNALLYL